jgi:hypothetical protein
MEAMREKWTDERMDDLKDQVRDGFDRLDADLRAQRLETKSEFAAVRAELGARFDATQRLILQVGGGMFVTMVVGFVGVVVSH